MFVSHTHSHKNGMLYFQNERKKKKSSFRVFKSFSFQYTQNTDRNRVNWNIWLYHLSYLFGFYIFIAPFFSWSSILYVLAAIFLRIAYVCVTRPLLPFLYNFCESFFHRCFQISRCEWAGVSSRHTGSNIFK